MEEELFIYEAMCSENVNLDTVFVALKLFDKIRMFNEADHPITALCCFYLAVSVNDDDRFNIEFFIKLAGCSYFRLRTALSAVISLLEGKLRPLTPADVLTVYANKHPRRHRKVRDAKNIAIVVCIYLKKYQKSSVCSLAKTCYHVACGKVGESEQELISSIHDIVRFIPARLSDLTQAVMSIPAKYRCSASFKDTSQEASNTSSRRVIKNPKYTKIYPIGNGSYGSVYHVQYKSQDYAVKIQPLGTEALIELSILSTYKHSNVIEMRSFSVDEFDIRLYLELGESLDHLLNPLQFTEIHWTNCYIKNISYQTHPDRYKFMFDIALGLRFLHRIGVIHRDIKTSNIIIVGNDAKIADFGLSYQLCFEKDTAKKNTKVFTLGNRPVELIYRPVTKKNYSFEVDIWALGSVFLELETGVIPFYWNLFNAEIKILKDYSCEENCVLWSIAKILGSPPQKNSYKNFPYSYPDGNLSFVQNECLRRMLPRMLAFVPKTRVTAEEVAFLCHYL